MPIIRYKTPQRERVVDVSADISVAKGAVMHGMPFSETPTCRGQGTCTKCRMKISGTPLSPLTEKEQTAQLREGERLACQILPQEGMIVEMRAVFLPQNPS